MFSSAAYDGALEKACIGLGLPCFSVTSDMHCQKLAEKSVRSMLLQNWKEGGTHVQGSKFQATPTGLPDAAVFDADSLQLCKGTGEGDATTLVVPSDIRQKIPSGSHSCIRMATNLAEV